MNKVFPTKVDLILFLPPVLILSVLSIFLTFSQEWPAVVIVLVVLLFILYLIRSIKYTIEGKNLRVQCGFFINKIISIDSITTIHETNMMLSAPAASLDRLEIVYNTNNSVLISPDNKDAFIKEILELNPSVKVNRRKR